MFCSSACAKKYRIRQNIEDRATKVTSQSVELEHSRVTYKWADKKVLTAREAAEYLGVSRKSIYRWTNQGILKPIMLPGEFLISKESIKKMFDEGVSYRQPRKSTKELPEFQGTPVYQHSNEYITITEASELYGVPLSVMQHWLRKSDLEFERFRNIRFYNREAVDKLVKKRQKAAHPEITEWYTVDEICLEFAMTRKQVYNFTGTHKSLPKRKDSGITYYSKKHVDGILKPKVDPDDYYTAAEVSEKYGIELRRLYKIAKRIGFSSYTTSGKIWYKKDDVDTFFSTGFVTPL
jgi:excisionase family DNA binding protein